MGTGSGTGVSIGSCCSVEVITFGSVAAVATVLVAVAVVSLAVVGAQPVIINIKHIAVTANMFASLAWRKHVGIHTGKDANTASFKCILLAIYRF